MNCRHRINKKKPKNEENSKDRREKPQRELSFTRNHVDRINYSRQNQNNGVNKKKVRNINGRQEQKQNHQKKTKNLEWTQP
jgi:hypothetical protein